VQASSSPPEREQAGSSRRGRQDGRAVTIGPPLSNHKGEERAGVLRRRLPPLWVAATTASMVALAIAVVLASTR